MNSGLPKQFHLLAGKPILAHTIMLFAEVLKDAEIIVVLPDPYIIYWETYCKESSFAHRHQIVAGGKERFHSVKIALDLVPDGCVVGVTDAVRPLVSKFSIQNAFDAARREGAAIPFVPVRESLRKITENGSIAVSRAAYIIVQTPQCFHSSIIKKAYGQEFADEFTDDASVVESVGYTISLVQGNPENIKITEPTDLLFAEEIIKSNK